MSLLTIEQQAAIHGVCYGCEYYFGLLRCDFGIANEEKLKIAKLVRQCEKYQRRKNIKQDDDMFLLS